uniref:RNA-binding protein 5 n=1 Tax=Anopheles culicifacies TaxID=139723 RepID=A0A182MUK0_9DIPT
MSATGAIEEDRRTVTEITAAIAEAGRGLSAGSATPIRGSEATNVILTGMEMNKHTKMVAGTAAIGFVNEAANGTAIVDLANVIDTVIEGGRRGGYSPSSIDDGENFDSENEFFYQQKPNNNIIIRGLAPQVTEADINSDLIQCGLQALHGVLVFNGQHAVMQYTFSMPSKFQTDWYCAKCYAFNFKRRENCFKCHASREDSEIGGDGSDEMSNILTKKIMLRNLDVLTNEESVMSVLQKKLPAELVQKIGKVVICRDPLTSISRGMCYVHFENLVDSMNTHNALKELDPPLRIDNREVIISYCMDTENRNLMKQHQQHSHQGREGNRQGNNNQHHGGQGNGNGGNANNYHGNGAGGNNVGYRSDGGNSFERNSYGNNHNSHGMSKNAGGSGRGNFQDITAPSPSGTATGSSNMVSSSSSSAAMASLPENYTLADVPRLAEYSASMYASNAAEHKHYLQYYTEYYTNQLSTASEGQAAGPRASAGLGETANNGAAVAQSAIARKQQAGPNSGKPEKSDVYGSTAAGASNAPVQSGPQLPVPNGVDGRKYPTPDTSLYQYDETSGFYYDPTTGLYYDANSQYYYNSETSSYLYWDPENQTYVAAPASSTTSNSTTTVPGAQPTTSKSESAGTASMDDNAEKMEKSKSKDQAPPQDKVKVAKKIVKDMEKWAKQLNQKKDYSVIQPPARIEEATLYSSLGPSKPMSESLGGLGSAGYADVGFSLLEKKERAGGVVGTASSLMTGGLGGSAGSGSTFPTSSGVTKSVTSATSAYGGSDSDNDFGDGDGGPSERDLVDFDRLTCLLCKRAFQSQEILMKHVKMSSLHKENLQKLNANFRAGGGSRGGGGSSDGGSGGPFNGLQYRDRAKERRQKYGEDEAPPVNRSKERFQREIEKQTQSQSAYPQGTASAVPIGQNNIGNKLLQKMGWSEGQGLGRTNQGRVNIIEAEARVANVGLGIKANAAAQFGRTTDDYKTYIKKMMKSRYEQVDVKD